MIEGGGSSAYPGVKVYLLLAVKNIDGPDVREVAERFKRTAKYTNKDIGGEIVDLNTDHRLREKLAVNDAGLALYEEISESAPVICVSSHYIGDSVNTDSVELLHFAEYEQDTDSMFSLIDAKMTTRHEHDGFVEWLRLLNEVFLLRPALFGLGLDLNKVIAKYLDKYPHAKSFAELAATKKAQIERQAENIRQDTERAQRGKEQRAKRATERLFNAVRRGDINAVTALIGHGADTNVTTPEGKPLAQYAEEVGHIAIADALRRKRSDGSAA